MQLATDKRPHLVSVQRTTTLKQFTTAWEVTPVHLKNRDPSLCIRHAVDLLHSDTAV